MFLKIFIFLAYSIHLAVSEIYDKVTLTYVYEPRCPFCLKFLAQQLYPGFKNLSNYINLELNPIVRRINDKGEITCSHGLNECFIAKAQACVFGRPGITGVEKLEFMYCTEKKAMQKKLITEDDMEFCVNSVLAEVVSYQTVHTCMNGEKVIALLRAYKSKQAGYRAYKVPWLAFFGEFNPRECHNIRNNFVLSICGKLTKPPSVCYL